MVDDLKAAIALFVELGLELEGDTTVEGQWVDRIVGLDGVRNDIAMMRTPDGHGRLELMKFHAPPATTVEPSAPVNRLGIRRIMFAVEDNEDVLARLQAKSAELVGEVVQYVDAIGSATSAAPRASSSRWPAAHLRRLKQVTILHVPPNAQETGPGSRHACSKEGPRLK